MYELSGRKPNKDMSVKRVGFGGNELFSSRKYFPRKFAILLCIGSFCAGMFFTNRIWTVPEEKDVTSTDGISGQRKLINRGQTQLVRHDPVEVSMKNNDGIPTLEKTISKLEGELSAARSAQESLLIGSPISESLQDEISTKRKYLMVIGINTAFNSRKRRDSVRATWMPQGEKRKKLEKEKGIVIRFVIGHSSTAGGILDKSIEAEDKKHGDFLRLEHVEGYLELSAKTKAYFSTAVSLWDSDFYVKVDDDVHVNIATLGNTLARLRSKPRVYIGCMKSGPILAKKGVRYQEPEHWKFGGEGNKYFRHATGQLYAISNDLATYIAINQSVSETDFVNLMFWPQLKSRTVRHLLHKYANEDVSLGAWLIGLDVSHIDDKRLCCGTPPDCEWKAQAGNTCVASFDWTCSGICRSDERIFEVHERCGEGENAVWEAAF